MLSLFKEIAQLIQNKTLILSNPNMQEQLENYRFIIATYQNLFNHEIIQNFTKSEIAVINESASEYLIICFEKTIILISQLSLNILDNFFKLNKTLSISYLNKSKDVFTKNIKMHYHEVKNLPIFHEIIYNMKSKIAFYLNNNLANVWKIIEPCFYGYLIHKSFNKTHFYRIRNLSLIEKNKEKTNEQIDEIEYIEIHTINSTTTSTVELIYHIKKEELMVIKKEKPNDAEAPKLMKRELENYQKINFPLLPKFYGTTENDNFVIIEYINGISLDNFKSADLSENDKFTIIFELILIVDFLHRSKFILRDIKPNNIIIDYNKTAVLIDFDRMLSNDEYSKNNDHTKCFSVFAAPELESDNFSNKCDIYSIGKVIYFLLEEKMISDDKMTKYKNTEIERIYNRCIDFDENKRPSISELLIDFYVNYHSQIQIVNFIEMYKDQLKNNYDDYIINSLKNIELDDQSAESLNGLGVIYSENLYVKVDDKKAFHYFSLAAEKKHKSALYNIGLFYHTGRFVGYNLNKAMKYYSLSADQNYALASYNLSKIYLNDIFDIDKAIYYLNIAANQNFPDAQLILGIIYFLAISVEQDIEKSIKYLTLAADQNNALAQFLLGTMHSLGFESFNDNNTVIQFAAILSSFNNKINIYEIIKSIKSGIKKLPFDLKKAIHYFSLAANQNYQLAITQLVKIYSLKVLIPQDIKESFEYLSMAAKMNDPDSNYYLGLIYQQENKMKEAHELYLKAANLNHPIAQFIIGFRYCDGMYFKIDIDKGIYYLMKASNNNISQANCTLGLIYYIKKFNKFDIKKAIHYFTLAAEQNDSDAQYYLGLIYYKGEYVNQDINKAINYFSLSSSSEALFILGVIYFQFKNNNFLNFFKRSADLENKKAQYTLGLIYLDGMHVKKNVDQGISYLKMCADNFKSKVYFILGSLYYEGKETPLDMTKAVKYFKESSSFNDLFAKNNLGVIYKNGYGNEIKQSIQNAIIYLNEAVDDPVAMFNLASIYFYYKPIENSIDESIKLLIQSTNKKVHYSNTILSLIFEMKFGCNFDKILQEIKKYSKVDPDKLAKEIYFIIKDQKLDEKSNFKKKYDLYRDFYLVYDRYKEVISSSQLIKIKFITEDFYEGFGL